MQGTNVRHADSSVHPTDDHAKAVAAQDHVYVCRCCQVATTAVIPVCNFQHTTHTQPSVCCWRISPIHSFIHSHLDGRLSRPKEPRAPASASCVQGRGRARAREVQGKQTVRSTNLMRTTTTNQLSKSQQPDLASCSVWLDAAGRRGNGRKDRTAFTCQSSTHAVTMVSGAPLRNFRAMSVVLNGRAGRFVDNPAPPAAELPPPIAAYG